MLYLIVMRVLSQMQRFKVHERPKAVQENFGSQLATFYFSITMMFTSAKVLELAAF